MYIINHLAPIVESIGAVTTGLTYEFDEFVWQDGTPLNFTVWATGHPSMNDSSAIVELGSDKYLRTVTLTNVTRRNAFCKMEAEPMLKCSETIISPTCETGWLQRNT
uniref:C-type lectin domain-containing protein n=1 Tax=Panagrellus redivivus TaxID=6233 RepID=A0A7E4VU66_PANRE